MVLQNDSVNKNETEAWAMSFTLLLFKKFNVQKYVLILWEQVHVVHMQDFRSVRAEGTERLSAGTSNNRVNGWLTISYFVKVDRDVSRLHSCYMYILELPQHALSVHLLYRIEYVYM